MTHQDIQTIPVISSRMPEALRALRKLARKAQRYGCKDIQVQVGDSFEEKRTIDDWDTAPRTVTVKMTNLLISGEAPRVGDHEFLARVDIDPNGNIVNTRPGVNDLDPRFRHSDGHCEHCKTRRRRKEVFVVRDLKTSEQLQIGRSCLRDYLGIDSPVSIVSRFRFFKEVHDLSEGWSSSNDWFASLEGLLALTAVSVRLFGWCSKGQASGDDTLTPTASYVMVGLAASVAELPTPADEGLWRRLRNEINEEDYQVARDTIKWAREELKGHSDYEHNLATAMAQDSVTDPRRLGLVISAVSAYHRAQEKELRRTRQFQKDKVSVHQGEPGQRLRGLEVVKEMGRVVGENAYGELVLVKFRDGEGNIYSWFTGTGVNAHDGEHMVIDGTVKRHSVYKDVSETQLTRVKVQEAA